MKNTLTASSAWLAKENKFQSGLLRLGWLLLLTAACALLVQAQGKHETSNAADMTLRSSGRVNPSTLALEINVPLGSYPGRGGSLPISLSYSSKLWRMEDEGLNQEIGINNQDCYSALYPKYSENSAAGWSSSLGFVYVEYTGEGVRNLYNESGQPYTDGNPPCTAGNSTNSNRGYVKRIEVHLPGGEAHELRASDTPVVYDRDTQSVDMTGIYYAVDGSNLKYIDDGSGIYRLYLPNGAYYDFAAKTSLKEASIRKATQYHDVNGNTMSYGENTTYPNGYWTDTLGRTIPVPISPTSAPDAPGVQEYQLPGIANPYKFVWKQLKGGTATAADSGLTIPNQSLKYAGVRSVSPSVAQSNTVHPEGSLFDDSTNAKTFTGNDPIFNPVVLTAIELPDGSSYQFSYNLHGEIDQIVYPAGGSEHFVLGAVGAVESFSLETPFLEANRGVTERKIYENDAAAPQTWTYSTGGNASVTINAPDGTRTERMLHSFGRCDGCTVDGDGDWGFGYVLSGMPYEERQYSAANQLIGKKLTTWTKTEFSIPASHFKNPEWHPRVTSEESIIYDPATNTALTTTTTMDYNSDVLTQRTAPVNVETVKQYGFNKADGTVAPIGSLGALQKSVVTTYLNDANYAANNLRSLPSVIQTKDAGGTVKAQSQIFYDEANYGSGGARGQVTRTRSWSDVANNQYVETKAKYDAYGNVIEATDGRNNTTTTAYDTTYQAYPVTVTSAVPGSGSNQVLTTATAYDPTTGLPTSTTDANGQISRMEYNDPLLRPTKVTAPNGQQTITEYGAGVSDTTRYVKTRAQIDDTKWKEGYSWYDGLGRTVKTQSVETAGDVFIETQYDNMGRAFTATNPYRAGETPVWTTTTFDAAGRAWKTTTPDGAFVETNYGLATTGGQIGSMVTVKDQALKQRRSITNALGQSTRVDEPTEAGGLGLVNAPTQPTYYGYDTLNNLTTVTQGAQTRSFVYDALSRLKSAANPESGTINYGYDNNGNLTSKTDARQITTTYNYDALNRVIARSYNDGITPAVLYTYDNLTNAKGKLIKVSSSVSTTDYQVFDTMGRVTQSQQTTEGTAYGVPQTYSYNLSGALIEEKYPSGRTVKNVLDNDGNLSIVQSSKNAASGYFNYAKNFTYTAAGAVSSMQLGNGKWESTVFNARLQPTQIALGTTQNGTDKLKLNFSYNTSGNADNNGNVLSQTITVPTETRDGQTYAAFTATQNYTYDSLNRLKSAQETVPNQAGWKQTFTYDRYGNRNFDMNNTTTLAAGCQTAVCNPTVDPNTNKLVGYTFDNAGNTKIDAQGKTFTYDAENKQTKVVSGSLNVGDYFYDGDGKRVKKITYDQYGVEKETTIFIYDASGRMVAEYATTTASAADAKVSYLTNDHLGSPRITTDANGVVTSRRDFMPFGEEVARASYGIDTVRQKFTFYERDNESGLDFAKARYYNSAQGRFASTDPILMSKDHLTNPQRWNLYIYVINNPLSLTDPDGKKPKKVIDVFITAGVGEGQLTKEEIAEWKRLKIKGVKINIYRIDNKTATAQKFIDSIMTKGRTTVLFGHSFTDGATYDKVLHNSGSMAGKGLGIEFYASTIVSKESIENQTAFGLTVDGKNARANTIAVFTCDFGKTFDNVGSSNGTSFLYLNNGKDGESNLHGGNQAALGVVRAVANGENTEQILQAARNGFNRLNPDDDDSVEQRTLPVNNR